MNVIILNILIATGISTFLAILLVIAEVLFANYGDCEIEINGKKKITVKGGGTLLGALADNKIFVPSACGGRGSCGFCKCKVESGGGPLLPTEKPFLTAAEQKDSVRLSCQVKVKEDIKINIPEEIFNIQKFAAVVEKIEDYTYDIKGVTFKLIEPKEIHFKAGQYVQLHTKKYGKVKQVVSRAYSISSSPDLKDRIQLIIRRVPDGICTTYVHDFLKEGDEVNFTGPYGDFFIRDTDAEIIYIAGGSGKAPIKSMMDYYANHHSDRRMVYFFGARTENDLYLTDYFNEFEKKLNFTYVPVLSQCENKDCWNGRMGYIPEHFDDFLTNPKNSEAYLCGSPGMIAAVEKALLKAGVPKENIYYDSFA